MGPLRPRYRDPTLFPLCSTAVAPPLCPHNFGFALSPTDIDRCAAGATNICGPGTCVNLPDGYRCVCSPGYQLHPSQTHCTGIHMGVRAHSASGWIGAGLLGGRVSRSGSRRSKQCCVVGGLRRSIDPVDKADLNLGETNLWEQQLMSLQNSRSEKPPQDPQTGARSPQLCVQLTPQTGHLAACRVDQGLSS